MKKAFFKEQKNGYDKNQVNKYIKKLIREYQNTYSDYLEMSDKYFGLIGSIKKPPLKTIHYQIKNFY